MMDASKFPRGRSRTGGRPTWSLPLSSCRPRSPPPCAASRHRLGAAAKQTQSQRLLKSSKGRDEQGDGGEGEVVLVQLAGACCVSIQMFDGAQQMVCFFRLNQAIKI